jgi:cell division protein FtsN
LKAIVLPEAEDFASVVQNGKSDSHYEILQRGLIMENRNILLVVICVCAFLVIVFGVALWFTLPKNGKTANANSIKNDQNDNEYHSYLGGTEPTPGAEDKAGNDNKTNTIGLVVGENKDGGAAPLDTPQPMLKDETKTPGAKTGNNEDVVLLKIPLTDKKQHATKYATGDKKTEHLISKNQPTPAPKKPKTHNLEYWIQAGSYKSKNLAEAQIAKLTDHGFSAQLITREKTGTMYFRVRIGPYTNKAEADKFLSWIKVIDGMEESYISQLKTQSTVN